MHSRVCACMCVCVYVCVCVRARICEISSWSSLVPSTLCSFDKQHKIVVIIMHSRNLRLVRVWLTQATTFVLPSSHTHRNTNAKTFFFLFCHFSHCSCIVCSMEFVCMYNWIHFELLTKPTLSTLLCYHIQGYWVVPPARRQHHVAHIHTSCTEIYPNHPKINMLCNQEHTSQRRKKTTSFATFFTYTIKIPSKTYALNDPVAWSNVESQQNVQSEQYYNGAIYTSKNYRADPGLSIR